MVATRAVTDGVEVELSKEDMAALSKEDADILGALRRALNQIDDHAGEVENMRHCLDRQGRELERYRGIADLADKRNASRGLWEDKCREFEAQLAALPAAGTVVVHLCPTCRDAACSGCANDSPDVSMHMHRLNIKCDAQAAQLAKYEVCRGSIRSLLSDMDTMPLIDIRANLLAALCGLSS